MAVRLIVFGGLLAAGLGAGGLAGHFSGAGFAALLASGLLVWTLIEYLKHRLAFHGFAPHSQHHANPTDRAYILAPLWLALSASAVLFGVFTAIAQSWTAGATMLAGVIAGYLGYEAIHLRIHSGKRGGAVLRVLRKHHAYHHFASDRVCYGVTSPLWDVIFRSLPEERRSAP